MEEPSEPHQGTTPPPDGVATNSVPLARPIHSIAARRGPDRDAMLLLDRSRSSAWQDIAVAFGLIFLFEMVAYFVAGLATGLWAEAPEREEFVKQLLLPRLATRALAVFVIVSWVLRRRGQTFATVGLSRHRATIQCILGLPTLGVAFGLVLATISTIGFFRPEFWNQMNENAKRIVELLPRYHPATFAGVALMIGFYEEYLFRGFLLTRLRRATGSWTIAVIASSAFFTLLHRVDQTTAALVAIAVLSLVFSAVTIWRRSIIPAAVAHTLYNFIQFIVLFYGPGDR